MMTIPALLIAVLQAQPWPLTNRADFDTTIAPGAEHRYAARLGAGESASIVFRQIGVDLVVDVYDPDGKLLTTVDSPNGRDGDEPVEIIARQPGTYVLRVRPYGPEEPAGRYHASASFRDAHATADMLATRQAARDSAASWLRPRTAVMGTGRAPGTAFDAKFDSVARAARVIGLGEGTHGSREFGDTRLRLTQRAIERAGYRIVAIEASAARLARVDDAMSGRTCRLATETLSGAIWIGRRTQRQLVLWLCEWNRHHPNDPVRLVGVDAQDFFVALPELRDFLQLAYGDRIAVSWPAIEREVVAADSQTYVFGNSRVDTLVRRQLFELAAAVQLDGPVLRRLHGDSAYDRAAVTLRTLAEFADFNNGGSAVVGRGRDWYMAANLLRVMSQHPDAKAVYWAHNAHIAHPAGRSSLNGPSGSVLRAALGCGYQAIAMTFGEGGFVAQRPNDLEDRLAIDSLPPNVDESVERVISRVASTNSLSMWGCLDDAAPVPSWLRRPQQMHFVGGLWRPGSNPSEANRPTQLLRDYDGLLYFPRVTPDEMPTDRPVIPARTRNAP